jgi:hypothetical protein
MPFYAIFVGFSLLGGQILFRYDLGANNPEVFEKIGFPDQVRE